MCNTESLYLLAIASIAGEMKCEVVSIKAASVYTDEAFLITINDENNRSMEQLSMSYDQLSSRPGSRDRSLLAVLQSQWREMSYNEDTKDFVLIVGERREELTVHKLILMVRCEKLTTRYLADKKELEYECLDPPSVRKVLQYLYTAEV